MILVSALWSYYTSLSGRWWERDTAHTDYLISFLYRGNGALIIETLSLKCRDDGCKFDRLTAVTVLLFKLLKMSFSLAPLPLCIVPHTRIFVHLFLLYKRLSVGEVRRLEVSPIHGE